MGNSNEIAKKLVLRNAGSISLEELMKFDPILSEHLEEYGSAVKITGISRQPSETYSGGIAVAVNFASEGKKIGRYNVIISKESYRNINSYFTRAGEKNSLTRIHTGC
jgi:hypothetical protein